MALKPKGAEHEGRQLERQRLWDEPNLEELLGDEIMDVMLRSAKLTRDELRRMITEVALRVHLATSRRVLGSVRD